MYDRVIKITLIIVVHRLRSGQGGGNFLGIICIIEVRCEHKKPIE